MPLVNELVGCGCLGPFAVVDLRCRRVGRNIDIELD
jgi:hypothetical protein